MTNAIDSAHRRNVSALHLDHRYEAAEAFKTALLRGFPPEREILSEVVGKTFVDITYKNINNFFESEKFSKGKIRPHDTNAPVVIAENRREMEYDEKVFQPIQSILLDEKSPAPTVEMLEPAFGRFSPYVQKNYSLFKKLGVERLGLVAYVAHVNSVAFTVKELLTSKDRTQDANLENILVATTAGALHDSFEELLRKLTEYDAFLANMIPPELWLPVRTLTNHYHLILKSEKEYFNSINVSPTKKQLINHLKKFTTPDNKTLHPYVDKLVDLAQKVEIHGDVIKELKRPTYSLLYLEESYKVSEAVDDYTGPQIKAVDLSYNGHGSDDLHLMGRIGNISKRQEFCDIGYRKKNIPADLRNYLRELQEDALTDAEEIIIGKLLRLESTQEHFKSAANSMTLLYPILFTDYVPKKKF